MSFGGFGQNNNQQQQSTGFGGFGSNNNNTTSTGRSNLNFPFAAHRLVPRAPIGAHWYHRSALRTPPSDSPTSWHLGFGQPQNSGFGASSGTTLFGSNNTNPSGGFGSGTFMAQAILDRPSTATVVARLYEVEFTKSSASLGIHRPCKNYIHSVGFHNSRGRCVRDENDVSITFWLV